MCQKGSLLQNRLPVKFLDVKLKDPMFKHEIFMRIDMKHSYFSKYFIICLQSIFSVGAILIELFVVCQKFMYSFCSYCYLKKF